MALQYVEHAAERMRSRGITEEDLMYVIGHEASEATPGRKPGRLEIVGINANGRSLKVVVEGETVITTFWLSG